jgi:flagellar basal body-associated protein FliL
MAKEKKQKKREKSKVPEKKQQGPIIWIVIAIVAVAGILAVTGNIPFLDTEEKGKSFHLEGKETRQVLNPAMFMGQTRAAYAAAKKYPEILNEVYCYCYCDEPPFHHKTLLSCFVEKHGAG